MSAIKKRLEYLIKHNAVIQILYRVCISFALRVIGVFVPRDEKLVLLSASGGRKYGDSPKILFEAMKKDARFADYRYVWALEKPDAFEITGSQKVTIDSWKYFICALRAKIWITSVNIERGLRFKKPGTIYINTWHGAGTKKIGNACSGRKDYNFADVDMMLVQSDFEGEIFKRDFLCRPEAVRKYGFPRNDELFHIKEEQIAQIRQELGIPEGKRVILYAPTWRDSKDGGMSYEFDPPIDMANWEKQLSDEYVLLFRTHPFTTHLTVEFNDFVRNVTTYENLNYLLAITDILITDYSTIIYDCVIAKKPFICFGYDYETYCEERGFYFDLNTTYPGGVCKTEEELFARLRHLEQADSMAEYEQFRDTYVQAGGNATEQVIEELAAWISKKK